MNKEQLKALKIAQELIKTALSRTADITEYTDEMQREDDADFVEKSRPVDDIEFEKNVYSTDEQQDLKNLNTLTNSKLTMKEYQEMGFAGERQKLNKMLNPKEAI